MNKNKSRRRFKHRGHYPPFFLTSSLSEKVRQRAEATDTTQAEILRSAVRNFLAKPYKLDPQALDARFGLVAEESDIIEQFTAHAHKAQLSVGEALRQVLTKEVGRK